MFYTISGEAFNTQNVPLANALIIINEVGRTSVLRMNFTEINRRPDRRSAVPAAKLALSSADTLSGCRACIQALSTSERSIIACTFIHHPFVAFVRQLAVCRSCPAARPRGRQSRSLICRLTIRNEYANCRTAGRRSAAAGPSRCWDRRRWGRRRTADRPIGDGSVSGRTAAINARPSWTVVAALHKRSSLQLCTVRCRTPSSHCSRRAQCTLCRPTVPLGWR